MFSTSQLFLAAVLTACALSAAEPLVTQTVFTAFDTETTGFSPARDRIVEIGAVRFRGDGEVLAVTNWLVNPEMPVPFYATEVHGITTSMTTNAPPFSKVWNAFAAFCGDTVLLAHNAPFDTGFLRAELARAELDVPPLPVIDTLPLFRAWFPQAPSHALGSLAASLGVDHGIYHRAEADSYHIIDVMAVGLNSRPQLPLRQMERDAGGVQRLDGKKP
jgi:DNA polymerase III epsilon subunit family exonuclease